MQIQILGMIRTQNGNMLMMPHQDQAITIARVWLAQYGHRLNWKNFNFLDPALIGLKKIKEFLRLDRRITNLLMLICLVDRLILLKSEILRFYLVTQDLILEALKKNYLDLLIMKIKLLCMKS